MLARSPLRSALSAELYLAIDLMVEADLANSESHLRVDGFVSLQAAVGQCCADRFLNLLLRGHTDNLEKFAKRHVQGFFIHHRHSLKGPSYGALGILTKLALITCKTRLFVWLRCDLTL